MFNERLLLVMYAPRKVRLYRKYTDIRSSMRSQIVPIAQYLYKFSSPTHLTIRSVICVVVVVAELPCQIASQRHCPSAAKWSTSKAPSSRLKRCSVNIGKRQPAF